MLYPVIDIGSNTVKLAILNKERLFWEAPVYFKAVPLNLRSHVVDGKLTDEATSSLCQWIAAFQEIARRFTPNPPLAFATASLRGLSNATEVLNQIRATCGVTAFIISGKTEAYFSFLGAKNSVNAASGVTVDLGGGSTEILSFERSRVLDSASLPLGCLTLYQKYYQNGEYHLEECRREIRSILQQFAPPLTGKSILLSGGSAKAVLKYKNVLDNKKSISIGTAQMRRIQRHFFGDKTEEKKKLEEILHDRFRLVPIATTVFSEITSFYQKEQVLVCRCGVREGCLYDYLKKSKKI